MVPAHAELDDDGGAAHRCDSMGGGTAKSPSVAAMVAMVPGKGESEREVLIVF